MLSPLIDIAGYRLTDRIGRQPGHSHTISSPRALTQSRAPFTSYINGLQQSSSKRFARRRTDRHGAPSILQTKHFERFLAQLTYGQNPREHPPPSTKLQLFFGAAYSECIIHGHKHTSGAIDRSPLLLLLLLARLQLVKHDVERTRTEATRQEPKSLAAGIICFRKTCA